MVKMINKLTGTEMFVDASRVVEYRNAGHKLVTMHGENPGNAPEKTEQEAAEEFKKAAEKLKETVAKLPKAPAKTVKTAKTTKTTKTTTRKKG